MHCGVVWVWWVDVVWWVGGCGGWVELCGSHMFLQHFVGVGWGCEFGGVAIKQGRGFFLGYLELKR